VRLSGRCRTGDGCRAWPRWGLSRGVDPVLVEPGPPSAGAASWPVAGYAKVEAALPSRPYSQRGWA